jgi:phosphoribosylaminoimidazole-succinocarboxamide synthase
LELIYEGKTKNVYRMEDGNILLKFKDDVTGTDGVFDPGANTVGLTIEGAGRAGLKLTEFFFKKINEAGIPTHFIEADIEHATMTVKPAKLFGQGVEVILRYRAVGSFYRRYGNYCNEGDSLDGYVEVTLKDDERNDPLITEDALEMLGIMTREVANLFINLGFKSIITCVDTKVLDGSFAGRLFNKEFLEDLPENADPCGENGEFHGFVFDGPIFRDRIEFSVGQKVLRDERFMFCDIL